MVVGKTPTNTTLVRFHSAKEGHDYPFIDFKFKITLIQNGYFNSTKIFLLMILNIHWFV